MRICWTGVEQYISNKLEKLEAARSDYLAYGLPLVTFGYLSLALNTFPYLWLPFLSFENLSIGYLSLPLVTFC